jgi:hypothetical protein
MDKIIELENRILGCEQAIQRLAAGIERLQTASRGLLAAIEQLASIEEKRGTKVNIPRRDLN